MNMNETFVPERRAAMHCAQLAIQSDEGHGGPSGGLATFKRFGKELAPAVAVRLAEVFNATDLKAQSGEPEILLAKDLAERIDPVAGNFVLPVGDVSGRLFASFALRPIMARLEAMFGGDVSSGEIAIRAKLPSSVELLLRRLALGLTQAIGVCLDPAAIRKGEDARFATDYAKLAVFPGQADAVVLPLSFTSEGAAPIELLLACRPATMARLLAHFADGAPAASAVPPAMLAPAIANIPLPLRARLAQMKVPASRLLALKPGQTLPLAVARSVPLFAGQHRIASGTIGELDDRVALQIDSVFLSGELS